MSKELLGVAKISAIFAAVFLAIACGDTYLQSRLKCVNNADTRAAADDCIAKLDGGTHD